MNTQLRNLVVLAIGISFLLGMYAEVDACTRVFWNTLSDLKIVARNEDYLTPVDPTMVITPRGIERVGSNVPIPVDVRVITATHKDLKQSVRNGKFREDLFYRLNVLALELPALRDRREDIEPIAEYYLHAVSAECHRRVDGFTSSALRRMSEYRWPGNVRELINKVHRAVVMSEHRLLTPADLGLNGARSAIQDEVISLAQARTDADRRAMQIALQHSGNNVTEAARQLGISRVSFYRIMEKLKMTH